MRITTTPTEAMADELRAAEVLLAALDQQGALVTGALADFCERAYKDLLKLRNDQLLYWNWEADCPHLLYRCRGAAAPYHMAEDGPCELYTTNRRGDVSVCDTCAEAVQS